ncbi:DUF6436 domain-containing protein [Pseudoalteromonas sp. P1-11]|uniref:DUF6436 domain-containing protein n=1 Tax=Pseudoalteromonas sp. P1-11 TaxID=1715254 RepID=UPI0006DD07DB|nr:DUF6436 domain-containing protein [Pseudoalteromonas sp. P1-11]KPW02296.1 hypothetical protein AN390_01675 [Pseudoalteromonas sp. P1-11]
MLNLSNSHIKTSAVIALWLVLTVSGLVYYQYNQLRVFDSYGVLEQPGWFTQFKQHIGFTAAKHNSLIIVTDPDCGCTKQAQPHLKQLAAFSKAQNITLINIEQTASLQILLPATPAAVVINDKGDFVYAGPLSQGLGCAQGSGFVETVINNLVAGFNSELLLNKTSGCYCTA